MNSGASIRGARNPEEVQEFIRFLFGSDMERQEEEPRSRNGITSVSLIIESGGSSPIGVPLFFFATEVFMRPCFIPGGMWGCGVAGELHRMHALLHTPDRIVFCLVLFPCRFRKRPFNPRKFGCD